MMRGRASISAGLYSVERWEEGWFCRISWDLSGSGWGRTWTTLFAALHVVGWNRARHGYQIGPDCSEEAQGRQNAKGLANFGSRH